jgi:hypothetical protein
MSSVLYNANTYGNIVIELVFLTELMALDVGGMRREERKRKATWANW